MESLSGPGLLAATFPQFQSRLVPDEWCVEQVASRSRELGELDRDPFQLRQFAARGDRPDRLGRYFERLLHFWVREYLAPERLFANRVIQNGHDSLGELDLLFAAPSFPMPQHWEATVKFYLCVGGESPSLVDFVGTNTEDRLDKKVTALFERQLKLVERDEAKRELEVLGFRERLESRALVKGALFYPFERDRLTHGFPPEVSPHHARGWWSEEQDIQRALEGPKKSFFTILERHRWLSAFQGAPDSGHDRDSMAAWAREHFSRTRSALMVAEHFEGNEISRGFIVPTGWREQAEACRHLA